MSTILGDRLPASVVDLFGIDERARPEGQCFLLITVDTDGQARPCLLSVGEMCTTDDRHLRALVWPTSRTAVNLDSGRPALLVVAAPPDAVHVRVAPRRLSAAPSSSLARFELTVTSVESDAHEGMPVTRPMWFATRDDLQEKVLAAWSCQHDALLYGRT